MYVFNFAVAHGGDYMYDDFCRLKPLHGHLEKYFEAKVLVANFCSSRCIREHANMSC